MKITKSENTYSIEGVIDENSDFTTFIADDTPELIVNFGKVIRINSCGVREWVNALRESNNKLIFVECAEVIVEQFNMIPNFLGEGKVESFYAPYICPDCENEEKKLFYVSDFNIDDLENYEPPTFPCEKCESELQFDEDEEEYFIFIEDQLGKK